jgi:kynurenine formamidase
MGSAEKTNWGRWGASDEKGSLNLLTPQRVLAALRLVTKGKVYSLAAPVGENGPVSWHRNQTVHIMKNVHDDPSPGGHGSAEDWLVMNLHASTHIDSFAHFWSGSELYNGHHWSEITHRGAGKCSIENVRWLIARGVLLDVPGLKGLQHLPDNYAVTAQDLQDAARREHVEVRPADVVLVRTGWYRLFCEQGDRMRSVYTGLSQSTREWIDANDLCAVGADNGAVEIWPPVGESLHKHLLRDLGCHLIEYLNLEELAADGVYEFCFVASPLRIVGGTASPLNPLALT